MAAAAEEQKQGSSSLRRPAPVADEKKMLYGEELRQAWLEVSDEDIIQMLQDQDAASFRKELLEMGHDELHERRLNDWCGVRSDCVWSWCCMICGFC